MATTIIQISGAEIVAIGYVAAMIDRDESIAARPRHSKIFPLIRAPAGAHVVVETFNVLLYVHIPNVSATNDHANVTGATDQTPASVVAIANVPDAIPITVGLVGIVGEGAVVVRYQAVPIGIGIADAILPTGAWSIAAQSTSSATIRAGSASVRAVRLTELG